MRQLTTILTLLCLYVGATDARAATDETATYYTLNRQDGLSEDSVTQLMQLPDGRMLVVTEHAIDLYDGIGFAHLTRDLSKRRVLPAYGGATHLYPDGDRLWVKEWTHLVCYDLQRLEQWQGADALLPDSLLDFFIDHDGRQWWLMTDGLHSSDGTLLLRVPDGPERLIVQDVETMGNIAYVFYQTGAVAAYALTDGHMLYVRDAYPTDEHQLYAGTSLVVRGPDSCFYQLRTGIGGGIFLRYTPDERQWERLYEARHLLHSLVVLPSGVAYITLPDGYMDYNLRTGDWHRHTALRLPDGSLLDTGVNAFCHDRSGGIWLGTYNKGIIYTSPLSGLFDTRPLRLQLHPVLSAIFVHGERVCQDSLYGGQVLTRTQAPYVRHLTFRHDQNSVAFQFSTMNYVRPRSTCYRYRLDGDWHIVTADSARGGFVDNRGALYLPLVGLAPGRYRLEVMASTSAGHWEGAETTVLTLEVMKPWWRTTWAYVAYVLLALAALLTLAGTYVWNLRRRLRREAREQQLMLRIQNLVEQVNQYENKAAQLVLSEPAVQSAVDAGESALPPQDIDFMKRATVLVEQHLADTQYTVEQLARDLCMERTGLYRRLTALMDTSPVVFIRSIRLHRAAELLKTGRYSVTEVSEMTGFGTVSYFGKCFSQEFGCKPSEFHR